MSELRIVFPMPPNVTNRASGQSHWSVQHREKKNYAKRLDELQGAGLIPAPPVRAFARSQISSVMHLGAAMDDDNALARHKPVIDWLKTRGYIVDDRKTNLGWHGFPKQIVRRAKAGESYSITLTLREL